MSAKKMKIGSATVTVIRPELSDRERETAEKNVISGLIRFDKLRRQRQEEHEADKGGGK